MSTHAQRMLLLRVAIGTLWSGFLFIAGLWIAARAADSPPGIANELRFGGVGFASLGMFVFTCVVADRLFPRADLRICGAVQLLFGLVILSALIYVAPVVLQIVQAGLK